MNLYVSIHQQVFMGFSKLQHHACLQVRPLECSHHEPALRISKTHPKPSFSHTERGEGDSQRTAPTSQPPKHTRLHSRHTHQILGIREVSR